jgi:hypothetical protein
MICRGPPAGGSCLGSGSKIEEIAARMETGSDILADNRRRRSGIGRVGKAAHDAANSYREMIYFMQL